MQLCYPALQAPERDGKGKKRASRAHLDSFHPLLRPAPQATTVPAQCGSLFALVVTRTANSK